MRIVHTISGIEPESGGPTSALCGLARAQARLGHRPHVVATWKFPSAFPLADALRTDGVDVTLVGPARRPFYAHPGLRPALESALRDSDVVHVHALWESVNHLSAVVARRLGKPYVWTPHGMLDAWNMRRSTLVKHACLAAYLRRDLNAAASLNAATDFEARQTRRLNLRPPLFVLGFGLDDAFLNADIPRGRFRARHGIDADRPMVLFLGRIQRGKGLETLVPALAKMKTPATLVIAGPDEGGYRAGIERLIDAHHVAGRVHFVGMIGGAEKLEALTDADVLAAPSAHENFGISVAEAIALGTGVVVSDQVGLADVITAHALGQVAPLTVNATAAALDAALDAGAAPGSALDSPRRARARHYARTAFAWPTIARQWIAHYQSLPSP